MPWAMFAFCVVAMFGEMKSHRLYVLAWGMAKDMAITKARGSAELFRAQPGRQWQRRMPLTTLL